MTFQKDVISNDYFPLTIRRSGKFCVLSITGAITKDITNSYIQIALPSAYNINYTVQGNVLNAENNRTIIMTLGGNVF